MNVLVTGATGYVGSRLIPLLLKRGHAVSVLVRDEKPLRRFEWAPRVSVHEGDLRDPRSVSGLCGGVGAAYYLVQSGGHDPHPQQTDRQCVVNFCREASRLKKCVYLSCLTHQWTPEGDHSRSREEIGMVLREVLPTLEFRCGPILGEGSPLFQLIRAACDYTPLVVGPKWFDHVVHAIGLRDVLHYLMCGLEESHEGVVEIGGERISLRDMIAAYARARGKRRVVATLPLLLPRFSIGVLQIPASLRGHRASRLVQHFLVPAMADTARARDLFPRLLAFDFASSLRMALKAAGLSESRLGLESAPRPSARSAGRAVAR